MAASTGQPSTGPSNSRQPSTQPSTRPSQSKEPTHMPSTNPSYQPTIEASTDQPSTGPSKSRQPSTQPSTTPSRSIAPSSNPSSQPTIAASTGQPSTNPSKRQPSYQPSALPSQSNEPSHLPSSVPTLPTELPSTQPTSSIEPGVGSSRLLFDFPLSDEQEIKFFKTGDMCNSKISPHWDVFLNEDFGIALFDTLDECCAISFVDDIAGCLKRSAAIFLTSAKASGL